MAELFLKLKGIFFKNTATALLWILFSIAALVLSYILNPFQYFLNTIPNITLLLMILFLIVVIIIYISYSAYLKTQIKEDKFQDWEWIPEFGIWRHNDIIYCPNCKTKNIVAPMQITDSGWRCLVLECRLVRNHNNKKLPPNKNNSSGGKNFATEW